MNDLYGRELRLFHNLFLPSVKLAKKERVGSRLRRRCQAPQTPFQRVVASPAAEPERLAELQRLRERLDPFALSHLIQTKREGIFQLSRSTVKKSPASAVAPPRRAGVSEAKDHSDARAKARTARGEKDKKQKITSEKRRPEPHDGLHSYTARRSAESYILRLLDRGSHLPKGGSHLPVVQHRDSLTQGDFSTSNLQVYYAVDRQ